MQLVPANGERITTIKGIITGIHPALPDLDRVVQHEHAI
jgi:hypothetical protein